MISIFTTQKKKKEGKKMGSDDFGSYKVVIAVRLRLSRGVGVGIGLAIADGSLGILGPILFNLLGILIGIVEVLIVVYC